MLVDQKRGQKIQFSAENTPPKTIAEVRINEPQQTV